MIAENVSSVYVWSVAIAVVGLLCLIVSIDMQKRGTSRASELRFFGIACACLAVIFASCSYFVVSMSERPQHIEHAP
ncbi:MAG TPA: hypothetical protein V6C81_10250 [Planktothrix sp.]|jgi:hypothetical protein